MTRTKEAIDRHREMIEAVRFDARDDMMRSTQRAAVAHLDASDADARERRLALVDAWHARWPGTKR